MRQPLLWKLYAGYVVLITAVTAGVGLVTGWRMKSDFHAETRYSLQAKAVLLGEIGAPYLGKAGDACMEGRIRKLGSETGARLTVIRRDGAVLYDSEEDPAGMEDHSRRPEILEARERGVGITMRFSRTLGVEMMYVALPIRKGNEIAGFARAALPLTAIEQRLSRLRRMMLLAALVAIAAGLGAGFLFVERLTKPLLQMAQAADSIATGKYEQRVVADAKDEIGRLGAAFNRMAENLEQRMETITRDRNRVLAILGGMVEGVIAVDRDGVIVHMNDVAGKMLGVSPADSPGRRVESVLKVPELASILRSAIGGESRSARELHLVEGVKDRIIEVRLAPLRDSKGEPAGAAAVLYDITDLRRLENVRRDFVANVSHELKTPLTAIRGLAETLIDDREMDPATHRRFLEKVRDQARRLGSLVTDLLTLSRAEAREEPVERALLDLRAPVRDSVVSLAPVSEAKGLSLEADLPEKAVSVNGDQEALRQVVDNLIDNGIKYTPPGGLVRIRLSAGASEALVEVEDTGCGIESEHLDRIFERFYRVDKARSRELGGTGLGLSIVKHVAMAHGGRVSVESAPGKGSVFRVHLPLAGSS